MDKCDSGGQVLAGVGTSFQRQVDTLGPDTLPIAAGEGASGRGRGGGPMRVPNLSLGAPRPRPAGR